MNMDKYEKMIRPFISDMSVNYSKSQLYYISSVNKESAIWQYLKRYQNIDFVKERLSEEFPGIKDRKLKKIKSQHIADCMRQSEEYFSSAKTADLSVRPLILYYGMLDLVKALIMFSDNTFTLETALLKSEGMADHGLTHGAREGTHDERIRDNLKDILGEFCYTKGPKSVFGLLHSCWSSTPLKGNLRFEVGDLASMHPSSWLSYAEHTSNSPKLYPAQASFREPAEGPEHFLQFNSTFNFMTYIDHVPSADEGNNYLESVMPRLASLYSRDSVYSPYGFRSKALPLSLEEYQPIYQDSTGRSFTMADPNAGIPIHLIEVEYIMLFILGSLTRYAPQKWLANVSYVAGDAMFVIEGFINDTFISFPELVLEELDRHNYIFSGDASRWG